MTDKNTPPADTPPADAQPPAGPDPNEDADLEVSQTPEVIA